MIRIVQKLFQVRVNYSMEEYLNKSQPFIAEMDGWYMDCIKNSFFGPERNHFLYFHKGTIYFYGRKNRWRCWDEDRMGVLHNSIMCHIQWSWSADHRYTIKSAFSNWPEENLHAPNPLFTPKVEFFVWQSAKAALLPDDHHYSGEGFWLKMDPEYL